MNLANVISLDSAQNVKQKIWRHSLCLSLLTCVVFWLGLYFLEAGFSLANFSQALAGTAAVLIGASFALSGFCYYWDFLDTKIIYRKYLGLVGFWYALAYSISLLLVYPDRYFFGFFKNFLSADFILGLSSMAIFTFMALISTDKIMIKMGPHIWRQFMRLGYLAWFLLVLRAWFLEKDLWIDWLLARQGWPSPRLVLSFFVIAVILFRISIEFSKVIRRNKIVINNKNIIL